MTVVYRRHVCDVGLPDVWHEIRQCQCGRLFISRASFDPGGYGWWRMGPLSRWRHRRKLASPCTDDYPGWPRGDDERMKVYLATAGEYSDYRIMRIFARKEDAEAYALSEDVEEWEVTEGPGETWRDSNGAQEGP